MQLILASTSFLRKLSLKASKLEFETLEPDTDESIHASLPISERVVATALDKARAVYSDNPQGFIVAGDTLTSILDETGKEVVEDKDNKVGSSRLMGKEMRTFTSTIIITPDGAEYVDLAECRVVYTKTSESNLKRITENDTTLRGGSLGVYSDSPGFTLIEHVEGTYGALFGINMPFVYSILEKTT